MRLPSLTIRPTDDGGIDFHVERDVLAVTDFSAVF